MKRIYSIQNISNFLDSIAPCDSEIQNHLNRLGSIWDTCLAHMNRIVQHFRIGWYNRGKSKDDFARWKNRNLSWKCYVRACKKITAHCARGKNCNIIESVRIRVYFSFHCRKVMTTIHDMKWMVRIVRGQHTAYHFSPIVMLRWDWDASMRCVVNPLASGIVHEIFCAVWISIKNHKTLSSSFQYSSFVFRVMLPYNIRLCDIFAI